MLFLVLLLLAGCEGTFDHTLAAQKRIVLADAYMQLNQMERARLQLSRAVTFAPDNAQVQACLGRYHWKNGNKALADAAYQRALEGSSDQAFQVEYGEFLCAQEAYEAALLYFKKAMSAPLMPPGALEGAIKACLAQTLRQEAVQWMAQLVNRPSGEARLRALAAELPPLAQQAIMEFLATC